MNFHLVKYEMSCGLAGQLPESTLPEVVFAGRSTVGMWHALQTCPATAMPR